MQKKLLILALAILVLFGGGVLLWQKKISQKTVINQPQEEVRVSETSDTADWKTYHNEEFGFELKYPSTFDLSENNEWSQLSPFFQVMFSDKKNPSVSFQVKVTPNKGMSEPLNIHLDHPVNSQDVLGGEKANLFILKNGYCDGPSCSEKIIALKAEKNQKFYIMEFHGVNDLLEQFPANLRASFHFIQK